MTEFLGKLFVTIFGSNSWLATILISMFPIVEVKGAIPVGMNVEFWGNNALSGGMALLFSLIGSCLIVPIIALIFTPVLNFLKRTKAFKKIGNFIERKVNKSKKKIEKNSENDENLKNNSIKNLETKSSEITKKTSTYEDKNDVIEDKNVHKNKTVTEDNHSLNENENPHKKEIKHTIYKMLGVFLFVALPLPLTGVWTGTCVAVALGLKFYQTCLSVILGNIVAGLIITFVCSIFPQLTTILFLIVIACLVIIIIYSIIKLIVSKDEPENHKN